MSERNHTAKRREGISLIELLEDKIAMETAARRKELRRKTVKGGIFTLITGGLLWGSIIVGGHIVSSARDNRLESYSSRLEIITKSNDYVSNETEFNDLLNDVRDENNAFFGDIKSRVNSAEPDFRMNVETQKRIDLMWKYDSEFGALKKQKSYIDSESSMNGLISRLDAETHPNFNRLKIEVNEYYRKDFKIGLNNELRQAKLKSYDAELDSLQRRGIENYDSTVASLESLESRIIREKNPAFNSIVKELRTYKDETLLGMKQADVETKKQSAYSSRFSEVQNLFNKGKLDDASKKNWSLIESLSEESFPGSDNLFERATKYQDESIAPAIKEKEDERQRIKAVLDAEAKKFVPEDSIPQDTASLTRQKPKASALTDKVSKAITWLKTYDDWGNCWGQGVEQMKDGSYLVVAARPNINSGGLLLKIKKNGKEDWSNAFENVISLSDIEKTKDGFIAVGMGYMKSEFRMGKQSKLESLVILKMDQNGKVLHVYNNADNVLGAYASVAVVPSGYVVSGCLNGNLHILKLGPQLHEEWNRKLPVFISSSVSIVPDSNGVSFLSTDKDEKMFFVKFNYSGRVIASNHFGADTPVQGEALVKDDGYVMSGNAYTKGSSKILLLKTNNSLTETWRKTFEFGNKTYVHNMIRTRDGRYLISGTSEDESSEQKIILFKIDSEGNNIWSFTYNHPTGVNTQTNELREVNDGYIIVGTAGNSLMMIKTDLNGNVK